MSQVIQIRRGTKANFTAWAASNTLTSGELGLATDTREIFVGDGSSNYLVGRVYIDTAANRGNYDNLADGNAFFETDTGKFYVRSGNAWVQAGASDLSDLTGSLDDIADGTNYKKVAAADITNGHVNKISDGTNTLTAAQVAAKADKVVPATVSNIATLNAQGNLTDSGVKFDDAAAASTTIAWTSQKISDAIAAALQGIDAKDSVRAATPDGTNITLSGTQVLDGVSLAVGDRVLVKNQTTAADNGIYVVAAGAWTRATDANSSAKVTAGMYCWVEEGTQNADSGWMLISDAAITLNTTPLNFVQFSGAGQITPGDGLDKVGNTISVNITELIGWGIEGDGSNNFRVKASEIIGDGLELTIGDPEGEKRIKVKPYAGVAGNVVPVTVTTDGVGVTVNTAFFDGSTPLTIKDSAITEVQIEADSFNNGIKGGDGSKITIDVYHGASTNIQPAYTDASGLGTKVSTNEFTTSAADGLKIKVNSTTTGTMPLNITTDGVGVLFDDVSIKNISNKLTVALVDGGTFS